VAKLYQYVGPPNIASTIARLPTGQKIDSADDLGAWFQQTDQKPNRAGRIVVTFVVDDASSLRVADRGSEHIACSGGRSVRSAGEMFFGVAKDGWRVAEVTNQSTGFSPEPESWPAVAGALKRASIPHPGRFTQEIIFRRCPACGERNVVKDGWVVCGLCGADLPAVWNFDDGKEGHSA
jgi:hypothetical protein